MLDGTDALFRLIKREQRLPDLEVMAVQPAENPSLPRDALCSQSVRSFRPFRPQPPLKRRQRQNLPTLEMITFISDSPAVPLYSLLISRSLNTNTGDAGDVAVHLTLSACPMRSCGWLRCPLHSIDYTFHSSKRYHY